MTASIDYPVQLPTPLRNGYDTNHISPLVRSELVSGRARQRRRYTSVPTIASVSWLFTQQQAQIFEQWFRWTLSDGAEWFNATLRTPMGLQPYECRFAEMYQGPKLAGITLWQFEANLEIRERQTFPDGWEIGYEYILMSDIFDYAMNREMPT